MQPYPVSVAEILGEHGATLHVEGDVVLGAFSVGEEPFEGIAPAHFAIDLTNTGSGIVAIGHIAGELKAECSRCLCEFPMLVTGEVEAFYIEQRYADEIPEETDAELVTGDETVDLAPALMSAITIEIPFAPLHDPECEGLCATCGADLNLGPCGCRHDASAENPFAALKALLPEEDGAPETPEGDLENIDDAPRG
jgi:DUF177 domain-containing protein